MGGGFGAKTGVGNYILLAAELAKRTGRPVSCALYAPRGERRRRQPQRHAPARHRGGPRRRHADRARRRVHLRARLGRLAAADGRADQLLYACENVRTVEHGAKLNIPPMAAFRAPGFVEGTWSLECLLDKLAAQLGVDPLELRKLNYAARRRDGRPSVLLEEPDGVLPARRAALGSAATRCAPARTRSGSAGWAWRARSGTAAAARRATPGSGSAPTAARTSSRRCRTSAPARGRRWR